MSRDDIRRGLLKVIAGVAPEAALGALDAARPLRAQLDLDSLDWLMVRLGVLDRLGVDIAEAGPGEARTLQQLVERCAAAPRRAAIERTQVARHGAP